MSVTVYRIEHTIPVDKFPHIGMGAYEGLFSEYMEMIRSHPNESHPDIKKDIGEAEWYKREPYYEDCYCACDTLPSLNEWFYGWKEMLLDEGYVVVAYEVTDVVKTNSMLQVMFHQELVISKKIIEDKFGSVI